MSESTAPNRPEFLDRAEAEKLKAEAEAATATKAKIEAEARLVGAQAVEAECKAAVAAMNYEREEHKRKKELAGDEYHHRYLFSDQVREASVLACIKQLNEWERMAGTEKLKIELTIDSPGGSVFDGFHLIDYIRQMQKRGHVINTTALGMAASMAGVLLQVGNKRCLSANAMLLIHEASFGAVGSFANVVDEVELVKKMHERILEIFADRAKKAKGAKAMTKVQIQRKWHRKDWWLTAQEAERYGFVDEIV